MTELSMLNLGKSAAVSRSDHVYRSLQEAILSGALAPGERLHVDGIARQLGISSTPVRDALSKLESDGLITRQQYQGSFVREFTDKEIRDLYEMRAGIEVWSVRLACKRITDEQLKRLRELQAQGEQALAAEDATAYRHYNHTFHLTIISSTGNTQLTAYAQVNSLQMQMLAAQTIRVKGASVRAVKEHATILQKLEERNAEAAQALVEHHIMRAYNDIEVFRASQRNTFSEL